MDKTYNTFTYIQRQVNYNEHRCDHWDNDTANQREDHHWSDPRGKTFLCLHTNWNGNLTMTYLCSELEDIYLTFWDMLSFHITCLRFLKISFLANAKGDHPTSQSNLVEHVLPLTKFIIHIDQESISISQSYLIILSLIHSAHNIHSTVSIKITNDNLWVTLHAERLEFSTWIHFRELKQK